MTCIVSVTYSRIAQPGLLEGLWLEGLRLSLGAHVSNSHSIRTVDHWGNVLAEIKTAEGRNYPYRLLLKRDLPNIFVKLYGDYSDLINRRFFDVQNAGKHASIDEVLMRRFLHDVHAIRTTHRRRDTDYPLRGFPFHRGWEYLRNLGCRPFQFWSLFWQSWPNKCGYHSTCESLRNWDYLIVCGQSYSEMVELGDFFIDVKSLPQDGYGLIQLCFLAFVYGYMLMYGSNMISDGSELLLLVPAWAGLVGSVVLPVLGAVPDGCMVLFSGLGPNAQGKRLLLA